MTEQSISDTGQAPKQMLADAGYCSAANLAASAELTNEQGTEFFIATGRQKRGTGSDRPPRTAPGQRHGQAAHGPQARHEEGPGRLRSAQSDRRTGIRADEHSAERQTAPRCGNGSARPSRTSMSALPMALSKPSTDGSSPCAESPSASATSVTTSSGHSSTPANSRHRSTRSRTGRATKPRQTWYLFVE